MTIIKKYLYLRYEMKNRIIKPSLFILDVDGVLSSGQFLYDSSGKQYKIFGAHDNEGLKLISSHIKISFISADSRGFEISKKRVEDLGFEISLIGEDKREDFFEKLNDEVVFMGDGYTDSLIFDKVFYSIAPKNAISYAIERADFVTNSNAAEGAVFEACMHLKEKFFNE